MRAPIIIGLLGFFLTAFAGTSAATEACLSRPDDRPAIGLVLGGGGARGAAHIGVIQKLEELRIPIDYITGTSMGSIVGGFHAAGLDGAELEELVTGIEWGELFHDKTRREEQSFRRKRDDDISISGSRLGVGADSTLLPTGAISGQKITFFFSSMINRHTQVRDFDHLPIPYRAIAADVITGDQVVMDSGDVGVAMRSSMSIPGAFSPVVYGDYMLVDGGIVNNVPIDVVRGMGADVVIAVDVGTPLTAREDLTNLVSITGQLTGFLVVKNSEEQLATLGEGDFHLQPKLGNSIGSADFSKVREAIPLGYQAADAQAERLSSLSLSPEAYAQYRRQIGACQEGLPMIDFVEIDNRSRFSDEVLQGKIKTRAGEPLDVEQLEEDVQQLYALGFLEEARYELVEKDGNSGIVFHVKQDVRGTQFLEWGLDVFGDKDSSALNLRLGLLKTDIDRRGSELRGLVQLGEDLGFLGELYLSLEDSLQLFFSPAIYGVRREISQFDDRGNRLAEYQLEELGATALFTWEIERHAALSAGIEYSAGEVKLDVGERPQNDFDFDNVAWTLKFQYDRVDDSYFPSSGTLFRLKYLGFDESIGSDRDFEQVESSVVTAVTRDRHTLIGGAAFNTTLDDDAPLERLYRAGGFTRLSGYQENELNGQHFGIVYGSYRYRLSDTALLPAFAGASLEYGNAVDDREDVFGDGLFAGSVYLGVRTPVGPLYIGYGLGEEGSGNYFLRLGRVFQRDQIGR